MRNKTWICPKCFDDESGPLEFKSNADLIEHNKAVHPGEGDPRVDPKVKEPVRSDPVKPTGVEKAQEAVKKLKPPIEGRQKMKIDPDTQTEKLELVYRYIGQCPYCGSQVETIPLDVNKTKNHFQIAWCPSCREKLHQREVVKL